MVCKKWGMECIQSKDCPYAKVHPGQNPIRDCLAREQCRNEGLDLTRIALLGMSGVRELIGRRAVWSPRRKRISLNPRRHI